MKRLFILLIFPALMACSQDTKETHPIRLNQIGYYPDAVKEFALINIKADSFKVLDESDKVVLTGLLGMAARWDQSDEEVMMGDFSSLSTPGVYRVRVSGVDDSHSFVIKENVYDEALDASIKSFYFQRASMAIDEQYGGKFARNAGHADLQCQYHPSTGREEGTLDSPGGWYDAGDYGKYVVNAAISVGQMLNILEIYPDIIPDSKLNIPESGNGVSDLLDELKYELDWVLTMQDEDGGVYHKLTAKSFSGFIMPDAYDLERLIIGKGTASSLNFAAVMAQAYRVFSSVDSTYANQCLSSAKQAWEWSLENDSIPFKNPKDVRTGEYGDNTFEDDFYWAGIELFISTGESSYLEVAKEKEPEFIHKLTNSWKFYIRNMGFHSAVLNASKLDSGYSKSILDKQIALADDILNLVDANPYNIGLELYEWGSNSDILNQAQILCIAHHVTGDDKYLSGAQMITDYIFGKNATGYSFLTGFGSKQAMFPHHRPSGADGIEDPVPGFIIGGSNKDQQDKGFVTYKSDFPARSYEDVEPSFASNEVCLNWNAPAVFVLGYFEALR